MADHETFHHQFSELDENFCTWRENLYPDKKICTLTRFSVPDQNFCTLTRKSELQMFRSLGCFSSKEKERELCDIWKEEGLSHSTCFDRNSFIFQDRERYSRFTQLHWVSKKHRVNITSSFFMTFCPNRSWNWVIGLMMKEPWERPENVDWNKESSIVHLMIIWLMVEAAQIAPSSSSWPLDLLQLLLFHKLNDIVIDSSHINIFHGFFTGHQLQMAACTTMLQFAPNDWPSVDAYALCIIVS